MIKWVVSIQAVCTDILTILSMFNLRLRDSINTYKELIDYAIELNHEVIAITEHETVANAIKVEEYYTKIKKEHPNFKVILGNEIYLCRDGLNAQNYIKGEDRYYLERFVWMINIK